MLALILVISHMALTVHVFASHSPSELSQCELCVVQGSSDAALTSAENYLRVSNQPGTVVVSLAEASLTAVPHPAWTQRAPPIL